MGKLILERRYDERVVVTVPPSDRERRVVIQVVRLGDKAVRLAFEAPADVEIHREEIQAEADAGRRRRAEHQPRKENRCKNAKRG